jgi:hypothetical protein
MNNPQSRELASAALQNISKIKVSFGELEQIIRNQLRERYVPDTIAAALIGATPATMRRWRHEGRGPRYVKVSALCRYKVADLEDWLARRVIETRDSQPDEAA